MARPEPRKLDVIGKRQITPNMLRVTLGGAKHGRFPGKPDQRIYKTPA